MRHALAEIFQRGDLRDPVLRDTSLTVTEVRMTPDLKLAIAYLLPLGLGLGLETSENQADREAVLAALERAAPFLQGEVARRLSLRFVPRLRFKEDLAFDAARRIDEVLRETRPRHPAPETDPDIGPEE